MFKFLFTVLISAFYTAQSTTPFTINGVVIDNANQPIPNVIIKIKDNSYEYDLKTNLKGEFSKKLYDVGDKIYIHISSDNYESIYKEDIPNNYYTFTLEPKATEIEEIVLEKSIIHKGDSIIYNATSFSNNKENKAIDLIKKLPNVDVDRNGKITINGKEVNKVLVESETFFTGGSALVLNSLPANAIASFDFINNYKESSIFNHGTEKTVLNISLKQNKKQVVFGDIFLNGNSYDKYKVGTNSFYYSPKTKINFISNLNNVNDNSFTLDSYIFFNGGTDRLIKDPISFMNNFNTKELISLILPSEKFQQKQLFNALNLSQNIFKNNLKLSIFNINNFIKDSEIKQNNIDFHLPLVSSIERMENITQNTNSQYNIFSFTLTNNKAEKVDFYYNLTLKNTYSDINQSKTISFKDNYKGILNEIKKNKDITFNQSFDLNYKLSKQHSQGLLINTSFLKNDYSILTQSDLPHITNFSNDNSSLYNYEKNNKVRLNFQHKYNFLYHHIIGINYSIAYRNERINNKSNISTLLDTFISLSNTNTNLGIDYSFKNRNLSIYFTGNMINLASRFKANNNSYLKELIFIPSLEVEYKNKKIGTFKIDFKRIVKEIPSYYYYTGDYMISNTYHFKGIDTPYSPITDKVSLSYSKGSNLYGYLIDLQLNYYNKIKDYIMISDASNIYKSNTILFTKNAGAKNNLEIRIEKSFLRKKISLISKGNILFEKQPIRINNLDTQSYSISKNFSFSIKSKFKGNYNFELYNNYNITDYKNYMSTSRYIFNEIGATLNLSPIERISIDSDFSINMDLKNNTLYSKSSIKILHRINNKLDTSFIINNVLGSSKKLSINTDDFFTYTQSEVLSPRFFYLGLSYKF